MFKTLMTKQICIFETFINVKVNVPQTLLENLTVIIVKLGHTTVDLTSLFLLNDTE